MHYGSGSVIPSRTAGFTNTGSPRPSRPGQLDQMMADNIAGGADPAQINEMSHASAAALLDRVHHTQDAALVERVLTLVDREGVDVIAELWSHAEPDSLPGILWRLYLLRTWMRKNRESIARLWRVGEPVATTASAIAGVDQAPTEEDIAHTADSILAGAFTGDFAVALERAAAFTDVVALGLRIEAKKLTSRGAQSAGDAEKTARAKASRLYTPPATCLPPPRISAMVRAFGGADDWSRIPRTAAVIPEWSLQARNRSDPTPAGGDATRVHTPSSTPVQWDSRRAMHSPGLHFLPLRAAFAPTGAFVVRRISSLSCTNLGKHGYSCVEPPAGGP